MIFESISAIIMVFILMVVGYIVTKAKWYSKDAQNFVSKFVFNVTLPCTIIVALLNNFSSEMIVSYAPAFAAAACGTAASYALGKIFCRILKLKRNRRGIFIMLVTVANCGFVGFPVSQALFGEDGWVPTIMMFMVQTIFINAVGFLEISADGDDGKKPSVKETVKRVFNPLLMTCFASIAAAALGLKMEMFPDFVSKALELLDGVTVPLSLIFIGMVMGSIGLRNLTPRRGMPTLFVLRFVASPLLMMLFGFLFGVDGYTITVMTVISSLPSMVQVSILAKTVGANVKYAVSGIFYTTVLSFAAVPIYTLITSFMF